nr:COP1-interacting protein 7-like [Tanacetum cinerariifolium]
MAPKRTTRSSSTTTTTTTTPVTNAQLKALIDQGVANALATRDADRSQNGEDSHDCGTGVRRQAPPALVPKWKSLLEYKSCYEIEIEQMICGMRICLSEYALMRMLSCLVEVKRVDVIMDVCLELGNDYKCLCAEPYGYVTGTFFKKVKLIWDLSFIEYFGRWSFSGRKFEEGHQVILIALDKGIFLDAVVRSSMIDAYVKQGNLKKGLEYVFVIKRYDGGGEVWRGNGRESEESGGWEEEVRWCDGGERAVNGLDEYSNKSAVFAYKYEDNTSDAAHEDDSKVLLQRVLETRKAGLQREQAVVYARALVAGFETDNLADLVCFADAFGSPRLRDACLNFMELCYTKTNDTVWMDEVAAMQAYSRSQYDYMERSGGILEYDHEKELRINTKIHVDNESAICVVKIFVYHLKIKHIEIRHHFIRDSYENRLIEMVKIHTDYNVADLLTKAFDVTSGLYILNTYNGVPVWTSDGNGYYCWCFPSWISSTQQMVINSPCLTDKKKLAIPGQIETSKELSNPLMAGSLPKTTLPTQLTTLKIKTVNDVRLQALIDGKKVVITEASIRHELKLNDAEGTLYLPNAVIFKELARMGGKTTSWNEFSSNMETAIICLANNQKFNFSKYILDNLKKNLEAGVPFYMFPRKHKPKRKEMKETEVSLTELHTEEHVPTTSNNPLPSGEDHMQLKELMVLCTNFSNKVFNLENEVIEMKSSHKAKIADLECRVEKLEEENMSLTKELKSFNTKLESPAFKETVLDKEKSSKQGTKIAYIDADAEVNLENMYNLDTAYKETVLSMQDGTDADGKAIVKEMVEVITTAKIIINDVSTAGGELNAANEEPVSAAPTNITISQPSEATKITVDITTAPKAKGIAFHDTEESTTRTASSKP